MKTNDVFNSSNVSDKASIFIAVLYASSISSVCHAVRALTPAFSKNDRVSNLIGLMDLLLSLEIGWKTRGLQDCTRRSL